MDWITGIQRAIDYIEDNLSGNLDYTEIAKRSFSSTYHFQRTFSILCGCTLGEYIRNRRLTLAGTELASGNTKVIDTALKYGYESPDSFAKAFTRFHGITPSASRDPEATLHSFARLYISVSLKGGRVMDYRIEEKSAFSLIGFKKRFIGDMGERFKQKRDFWVDTRKEQDIIMSLRDTKENIWYDVNTNFGDDGYDHFIAVTSSAPIPAGYERINIPKATYVICKTDTATFPTLLHMDLRKRMVEEWLPSSDYLLAESPEVAVTFWYRKPQSDKRYIELWLPIEKK